MVKEFTITRATTRKDFEDCAFVTNTIHKDNLVHAHILIHDTEHNEENLLAVARLQNEIAGTVVCKPSSSPQTAFTMIRILEPFRRRGLGEQLYKFASQHAKGINRFNLQGRIIETDLESISYFEKKGFKEVARECQVSLYTDSMNSNDDFSVSGVELFNLLERKDLWQGAYAIACESIPDIPMPEPLTVPPYEKWIQSEILSPEVRLDGSFVAVADNKVIGYGGIAQLNPTTVEHLLTAVARNWRGKGIARLIKQSQAKWAKAEGIKELITYNEQWNEPIRKLNKQLGYIPHPAYILFRGPLHDDERRIDAK
ncbi:GNAT family N-acetyltransferase [Bacillus sp. BGMRC 2118]|nr:GNAT family N-acetyltransferase [Bacillus sp. BGMRC 2118]